MRNLLITVLLAVLFAGFVLSVPQGPTIINQTTENATPAPGTAITTAGGSFTTLVLNGTTQTTRWKAYVGNVTGQFTLDDANGSTIYDWQLSTVTGEVYASRNGSVTFGSIGCAAEDNKTAEDALLNSNSEREDSINNTFDTKAHTWFLVGTTNITNSSCYSIATYVNSSAQADSEDADFQEILLTDGDALVYATLLEDNQWGYDNQTFDFQMIVAERELGSNSPYYFWVELG